MVLFKESEVNSHLDVKNQTSVAVYTRPQT